MSNVIPNGTRVIRIANDVWTDETPVGAVGTVVATDHIETPIPQANVTTITIAYSVNWDEHGTRTMRPQLIAPAPH